MKQIKIGRSGDNNYVIDSPTVSGHHATIVIADNGTITLTDHSTNGTTVNGRTVNNTSVVITRQDNVVFPGGSVLDWRYIDPTYSNGGSGSAPRVETRPYGGQPYGGQSYGGQPYGGQSNGKPQLAFMDAVKTVFSKYICFTGRARRSEYWWFMLFNFAAGIVIGIFEAIIGDENFIIGWIYSLAVLLPSLGVAIRRLHDVGKSWLYILFGLIPLVGQILLIVWYAGDSQPYTNEFGPSPKYE